MQSLTVQPTHATSCPPTTQSRSARPPTLYPLPCSSVLPHLPMLPHRTHLPAALTRLTAPIRKDAGRWGVAG